MVPQSGTHQPSQDLLLPTRDPVGKLLGQRSGKEVLMDQGVLMPTPEFEDTSGPLGICGLDSHSLPPGRELRGRKVTAGQHVDLLTAALRRTLQPRLRQPGQFDCSRHLSIPWLHSTPWNVRDWTSVPF